MMEYQLIIRKAILILCCFLSANLLMAAPSLEGIQIYQRNLHLSPERKQSLAEDISRYRTADTIWSELRHEFTLPHYEDNPLVQEKIDWFLNHQDYLLHSMTRAAPYLYYILQQSKKRHLPAELVLLPIIESAYNPFALNASSGASGMWQMMRATASGYGIRQTSWYDGRRDVIASTKAALNHLAYLQTFFQGNWLLAIAAYDTGEGNVLSAIRKNIRNAENTDYWSLPLAQETRDYVPQLLALAIIIAHPEQYPIEYPQVQNAPYLAQVDIGTQINLKYAAYLAGLSFKALKQLNPGFSRTDIGPEGPFKIVLPIEKIEQFTENLAMTSKTPDLSKTILEAETPVIRATDTVPDYNESIQSSSPVVAENMSGPYTMQPGDTLYMVREQDDLNKIAKHFHLSSRALASANQLDSHKALVPGQRLIIPTHPTEESTPDNYQISPGDTVYMVRRGDSVETIANKFHTTPEQVRLSNLLASNELQEGDRLVIPTHV